MCCAQQRRTCTSCGVSCTALASSPSVLQSCRQQQRVVGVVEAARTAPAAAARRQRLRQPRPSHPPRVSGARAGGGDPASCRWRLRPLLLLSCCRRPWMVLLSAGAFWSRDRKRVGSCVQWCDGWASVAESAAHSRRCRRRRFARRPLSCPPQKTDQRACKHVTGTDE